MSYTTYGVNDALAQKLWSKYLATEALNAAEIAPLIGDEDSKDNVIQLKTDFQKSAGDRLTYGLRMQLDGDGFTENETAEGEGEALTTYHDNVFINELLHVVGVKSERSIDQQRVPFNLRDEARDGLKDWWAKRFSVSFFNQVCGNTVQTDTKYTGLNAVVAPSSTRIIRAGSQANDQSLTSNDIFTLDLIDKAKEIAETATPPVRMVNVSGKKKYIVYLHNYHVTSLRTNTSTGQWQDIQKAALMGGMQTKNPIYTSALGEYHDCILRKAIDIPLGVNSSTGAAVANTRRAVLLGAQAACIGFAKDKKVGKFWWNEELMDHKRKLEVSAMSIFGLKKSVFNSLDFGTVVISTYAAAAS